MINNYNEKYQYNSCVSRGICSLNPRTSSLQEVLILYLRLIAFYALRLYEKGYKNNSIKEVVMNTISVMVSDFEFSEKDFITLTKNFEELLPKLSDKFYEIFDKNTEIPEALKEVLSFDVSMDMVNFIRLGEKKFLKNNKNLSLKCRSMYQILLVLAKSICINVLDLSTYDIDAECGYIAILRILDYLNKNEQSIEDVKQLIEDCSDVDNDLMEDLKNIQKEKYGNPVCSEVNFSTTKGKALLVIGSNLRELENVLEAVKTDNIDVYTHDGMILAYTYPKFRSYQHLKGQYGQGVENCLLDFATFPGPIILTRHSLYNVKNLYRGHLYSTGNATIEGVIPIKNNDFSKVIEITKKSRGFRTGKICDSITIGFNYESILNEVLERAINYNRVFIIGLGVYESEQAKYFERLIKQTPKDTFIISLSYCKEQENVFCIEACYNSYIITRLSLALSKMLKNQKLTIFIPKCDRHTISQIIFLKNQANISIYLGECAPIMINPNVINTFQDIFEIMNISTVKKDLEEIISN